MSITNPLPTSIDETMALLSSQDYVASKALATVLFLSLKMQRPLFLEGEAGVGKTEIAKVLSKALDRPLIRLQCYEGLDVSSAVYEWNYPAQMLEIRLAEATGEDDRGAIERTIFSEKHLIRRPVLQALEGTGGRPPVFLIDELDRTDEAFEAFLLEVLSDFQVTIPELRDDQGGGTAPIVIITTNRTREIHDASEAPLPVSLGRLSDRRCANWRSSARKAPQANKRAFAKQIVRLCSEAARDGTLQECRASPRRSTGQPR
jgi:MoxR-like ATPase